ncbi:MAG: adenine glycosylase [Coriobacteriia bacterium]|nr:adenine glycosylase [Coriobacteriia bacterium]
MWHEGNRLYRDLPWRGTDNPYEVLISEIMLQQTQVSRVLTHWERWLAVFPTVDALAAAPLAEVLERWQGLGYNRRAVALKRCADIISAEWAGEVPHEYDELLALPGIGPATAGGVCVFAYQKPQVYLETNVRTVFIHEFFAESDSVKDTEIIPLVEQTCSADNPRGWYYALLDYGSYLKKTLPNPSRRSAHHSKQSSFEGSVRQKRAELLRLVLAVPGQTADELTEQLSVFEQAGGRDAVSTELVLELLAALEQEGFLVARGAEDAKDAENTKGVEGNTPDAAQWYVA